MKARLLRDGTEVTILASMNRYFYVERPDGSAEMVPAVEVAVEEPERRPMPVRRPKRRP
jgi:hypothetical protein